MRRPQRLNIRLGATPFLSRHAGVGIYFGDAPQKRKQATSLIQLQLNFRVEPEGAFWYDSHTDCRLRQRTFCSWRLLCKTLSPSDADLFRSNISPSSNRSIQQAIPNSNLRSRSSPVSFCSTATPFSLKRRRRRFADAHSFRLLAEDNVATNPGIMYQVETFAPSDGFKPSRPYATRLRWRDLDGNDQSKLLLTKPDTVIAVALRGQPETGPERKTSPRRPPRSRGSRRQAAAPEK